MGETENRRAEDIIAGRNAVMEALRADRPLDSVLIAKGERSGSLMALTAKCRERGIPIKEVDSRKLDALCGPNHQGIAAVAACREYATLDDLFAAAQEKGEPPFLVICDELEDPHNLGRSGAHGGSGRRSRRGDSQAAVSGTYRRCIQGIGRSG